MVTRMASIDEIIRQTAPGDPRLFEALMVGHYNTIYRLTNAVLQDSDEADDAAQETFIQAAAHIADYQPGTNIKSWLAKIAVNLCRDKLRRKKTRQRLLKALKLLSWQGSHASPSPEEAVICGERKRIIRSVIDSLDEKHRLPVILRYMQGMPVAEIAEVLELNEGTIHSRLHYAHRQLRERLFHVVQDDELSKESFV
jgi:RNA polymerase sigma-70 factor, ECF subfamily